MDPMDYIHTDLTDQSVTCAVYRSSGSGVYNDGLSDTGETVEVTLSEPSSSSVSHVEGIDEDTSLVGQVVPEYDDNGDLTERLEVNDELRAIAYEGKRYEVSTKDGIPNELDPEIWALGLEPANQSD